MTIRSDMDWVFTCAIDESAGLKDECVCGEINMRHCPVHQEQDCGCRSSATCPRHLEETDLTLEPTRFGAQVGE